MRLKVHRRTGVRSRRSAENGEEREKVSLARGRQSSRREGFYVTCYRENKRSAAQARSEEDTRDRVISSRSKRRKRCGCSTQDGPGARPFHVDPKGSLARQATTRSRLLERRTTHCVNRRTVPVGGEDPGNFPKHLGGRSRRSTTRARQRCEN